MVQYNPPLLYPKGYPGIGRIDPTYALPVVRRCKLDPNLKALGFKRFNLMKRIFAFNLNLVSELVPLHRGGD